LPGAPAVDDVFVVPGPGLIASVWRYRLIVVTAAVVAGLLGGTALLMLPATYSAESRLVLRDPGGASVLTIGGPSQSGDHDVFMATQAALAASDEVFRRAGQSLRPPIAAEDVRDEVTVGVSADGAALTVTAVADDPGTAADLANAVGTTYATVSGERVTAAATAAVKRIQQVRAVRERELDGLRAQNFAPGSPAAAGLARRQQHVADLIGQFQIDEDSVAAQAALYGNGVELFERADDPTGSSRPGPLLGALAGILLGAVAGGGWAWRQAARHPRVEDGREPAAILGAPSLGEVLVPETPGTADARQYQFVVAALEHELAARGAKTVAVTGPDDSNGRSAVVAELALAAARDQRRVVVVDAGTHGRLTNLAAEGDGFEPWIVDPAAGLGAGDLDEPERILVLRAGRPAVPGPGAAAEAWASEDITEPPGPPAGFYRSSAFRKLLLVAAEQADLVLVDTPGLLGAPEAVAVAEHADAVVLVVPALAPLDSLERSAERLAFVQTPPAGYLVARDAARGR
jgi:Mrp family chromosome partitioning ATPase